MIAAFIFLNPKLAFGALFKLFPFGKFQKFLIFFTHRTANFVLFASHFFVPLNPTVEAVLFLTLKTLKPLWISFFEKEHVGTVGCRAPGTTLEYIYID